jgi:hypothetical protein
MDEQRSSARMDIEIEEGPSVFLLHIVPAPGVSAKVLEKALLARAAAFAPAALPTLDPALFSHRILRDAGGGHAWQITFDGADVADGDAPAGNLREAIAAEVHASLAGLGEVASLGAYVDLLVPAPGPGFGRGVPGGPASFAEDDSPGWADYAAGSGAAEAGTEIDADVLADIDQNRGAVPVEPGLKPWGGGYMYAGAGDASHRAYLETYLTDRVAKASPGDRRKILAFKALLSREGSTTAINTYDNQVVTWGTGWGGLGWLGQVMGRAVADETLRETLGRSGVRYRGKNVYDVVDLDAKQVVTGMKPALQVVQRSLPLLYLLIGVARDPATRDAATDAQLRTFMEGSGNISGSDAIATQALFNLIAHLKHWAPGYVIGCLEWAVPQAGDGPSEDRDRRLAVLAGRYFFGKAHRTKWIPSWKQFQLYWQHMKADGLDCLSDPFIQAAAPPSDDPFASTPVAAAHPAAAPSAPVAHPAAAPAAPAAPVAPAESVLRNAPIAGQPDLEAAAAGKSAIRSGARGAGVKALQEALIALGIDVPGGADGAFGPGLEGAVKAFQAKHGLGADGVVGRGTLAALDASLGAKPA